MIIPIEDIHGNLILEKPDGNKKLFKYFSNFGYFKDFIESRSLYFRRIDQWDDKNEGMMPDNILDLNIEKWLEYNNLKKDSVNFLNIKQNRKKLHEINNQFYYGCSFQINKNESDYMWKHYADNENPISIKTSVCKLENCLEQNNEYSFCLGCINYDDTKLNPEFFEDNNCRSFFKGRGFKEEMEFRAIMIPPSIIECMKNIYYSIGKPLNTIPELISYNYEDVMELSKTIPNYYHVKINLINFIEEIIIGPNANINLETEIRSLINNNFQNPEIFMIRHSN
jgi:hypothetical protein